MNMTGQIPQVEPATVVEGSGGVVTCAHPLAASAGIEMLEKGGNAFDAMVAMSWALTVTEPTMSGLLGVTTYLTRTADGTVRWLDGIAPAPRRLRREVLQSARNYQQVGCEVLTPTLVPSNVRLLDDLGSLPLRTTMEPARRLAEGGFAVGSITPYWFELAAQSLGGPQALPSRYRPSDLVAGQVLRQPAMAEALEAIAEAPQSWLRDDDWGAAFVETVASAGGVLSVDDVTAVDPQWRATVTLDAGDWRVHAPGWPNASFETLVAIGLMLSEAMTGDTQTVRLARSIALAAQDRIYRWTPEMTNDEVHQLFSPERLGQLIESLASADPKTLDTRWQPTRRSGDDEAPRGSGHAEAPSHTSHFAALDADGNTACATQTLGGLFGAGLWVRGLPINGLGSYLYSADDDAPAGCSPEPGRPPASILEMLIAERRPEQAPPTWFTMGSPGGFVIPGAVAQGTLTMIEEHLDDSGPQEACTTVVDRPRIAVGNHGAVTVEGRVSEPAQRALSAAGFEVTRAADWAWVMGCLDHVASDGGSLVAAADPRRAASAKGLNG